MKCLNFLFKPASSLCNMRCRYCFYTDIGAIRETRSYGIMSENTLGKILDNVFTDINDGDEINFAFQGGEPTLAGLPWFRRFTENVAARKSACTINYSFQTNGLILDESWCEFFLENNFLVGLSIDAGRRFHDRNRFYADNKTNSGDMSSANGTFADCMRSKELLDNKHVNYNILCVLTNDLAKEPEKAWRFIINENIRYIQFIPCLDPPAAYTRRSTVSGATLRPASFAKFYSGLLPWWIKEMEKGNYISIKLFDDVVNYFLKGIPNSCGIDGQCHNQYVIEADGSVFPCDFYTFDKYKIGNLSENTPKEIFNSEKVRDFISEKPELPKICESCRFFPACRGGCKRMRNVMYTGIEEVICGFRSFLEKCLEPLEVTVKRMFR